ncbi:MAG: hypothetical protein LBS16_00085 [Prevotellaceae bacterium]|jgi:hypothetical protein|nr:hypothetical protein [Prevotellaceae bacterium]
MARPIKPTPILYGKEATNFELRMQNPPKISLKEKREMEAAYKLAQSRATFAL